MAQLIRQSYSRRAGGRVGPATIVATDLTYDQARALQHTLDGPGGGRSAYWIDSDNTVQGEIGPVVRTVRVHWNSYDGGSCDCDLAVRT